MTDLFSFSGEYLRDKGIQQSLDSADNKNEKWSVYAYNFLVEYIQDKTEFMTEDVRLASESVIPEPPSKRAWGGVVVRAVKNELIRRKGFKSVKNSKAHCTPATLWEVI